MEWKMQLFVARQARIRFIASKIGLAKKTMAPVREIRGPYVVRRKTFLKSSVSYLKKGWRYNRGSAVICSTRCCYTCVFPP